MFGTGKGVESAFLFAIFRWEKARPDNAVRKARISIYKEVNHWDGGGL